MEKMISVTLFVMLALACVSQALTPTTYLSMSDKARLKRVFETAWEFKDLPSVHYAVAGYKLLGEAVPNSVEVCKFLKRQVSSGSSVESVHHSVIASKALEGCSVTLPSDVTKKLTAITAADGSSLPDLFHAILVLKNAGQNPGDTAKIVKLIQSGLKKDDSLINLGYAFHAASVLQGDVTSIFERTEDAIVQADEVDGKHLQFEGGLSLSAFIISGVYRLSAVVNKPPPITPEQAVKFASYLLSRKSVQMTKGAFHLLDVLSVLTSNKFHLPVSISLASSLAVSQKSPLVRVQVTNLVGGALGPMTVIAESATRLGDDAVILSKKTFEPVAGDSTLYQLNLMDAKPARGFYRLIVSATPTQPDSRLVGNTGATLNLKVLATITVDSAEIGVADADQTIAPKMIKLSHPTKFKESVIGADHHQKLLMKFVLKTKEYQEVLTVHQAFVKLTNVETKQEIIFVAEPDASKVYRFDMDVGARAADFAHQTGTYLLELVVGDATASNSFAWKVVDVALKFPDVPAAYQPSETQFYKPKPEIQHLFREPEQRPPAAIWMTFSVLVCFPLLVLLVLWARLGINVSNFPLSLSSLGFHLGLAGIFGLCGVFWLHLNMFQTLKYLVALGVVTFFSGNKLLAKLAAQRKQ